MNTRALLVGLAAAALLAGPALAAPPASTTAQPATTTSTATPAKVTPVKATKASARAERRVAEIKSAQEKLKGMNLYTGPVDGKRNATYVKSLEGFQRDHKLTANGHLNGKTEKALGI